MSKIVDVVLKIKKILFLLVMSLLITIFGMSKVQAYFQKDVNVIVPFTTVDYEPLELELDQDYYIKGDDIYSIKLKDIYYIEATENKTFIYLKDDCYESKLKLYEIENELKDLSFFRCSKSMILHYSKIECVTPAFNGRFEAKLKNGEKVIISRQYVPVLKEILGI